MMYSGLVISLIIYCIIHSILADPDLTGSYYYKWWYRFFYVVQSVVFFVPAFYFYQNAPAEPFFQPDVAVKNILYIIWVSAIAFGLYAVRSYDNQSFLGISQLKAKIRGEKVVYKKPELTRKGALSVVRHPYYTAALVLLWSRPLSIKDLYVNIILTIYFLIGTMNEERKLKKEFGREYLDYMKEVPALVPFIKPRK